MECAIDGFDGVGPRFFVEGEVVLLAEGEKARVNEFVVVARHARPEVVFDLVIEVTRNHIDEEGGRDVLSGGESGGDPIAFFIVLAIDGVHGVVQGKDPAKIGTADHQGPGPPEEPGGDIAHPHEPTQHGEVQGQRHRFDPIKVAHHPQDIQDTIDPQHRWGSQEGPIPRLVFGQSSHRLFVLLLIPRKQRQRSYIQIHLRMVR